MSLRGRSVAVVSSALGLLALVVLSLHPGDDTISDASGGARSRTSGPDVLVVAGARWNTLTWAFDAADASFRVYRATSRRSDFRLLGTTGQDSFRDRPPARGVYWYRVVAVGLDGSEAPSAPTSSDRVRMSATIGPSGGTMAPTTGTVRLRIPRGAVEVPVRFTIQQLPSPPGIDTGHLLVTRAFDIGPSGTTFRRPATLTLRYRLPVGLRADRGSHDGAADLALGTRYWDERAGTWTIVADGSVHPSRSTLTARIPHLSLWAAGTLTLPHGGYSSETDLCGTCHLDHRAPGDELLLRATERETCYQCHSPEGGATDVRSELGEETIGTSTRASTHPIVTARDDVQLLCSDCHTAHRSPAEDTALLRVSVEGGYLYSPPGDPIGNAFCYACHGEASTYPAPMGDQTGFETSSHNVAAAEPSSGSGIRCLACHDPHGSDRSALTIGEETDLCYACHTEATPTTATGSNPYESFHAAPNDTTTEDGTPIRIYHHPVDPTEQEGGSRVVACASCHDPHLVDPTAPVSDPANTGVPWTGDGAAFCVLCHVRPDVTEPIAAGSTTPVAIRMIDDTSVDADGRPHDGFSSAAYFSSAHWLGEVGTDPAVPANLACTVCHDAHGSSNASMLRETITDPFDPSRSATIVGYDGTLATGDRLAVFCTTCHPGTDPDHAGGELCTACHFHGSDDF